ncbi:hypothetical protein N9X25_10280 [Verrucomicrobiales bacterium]|nr:hypothetical protein [Verrucomicrobiales bacterium]
MKAILVSAPSEIAPSVLAQAKIELETALGKIATSGNEFVVNDTKWFQRMNRKATPTVMNSAKFITGAVARNLEALGWKTEKKLHYQKIDGFKEFECEGGVTLTRDALRDVFLAKWDEGKRDEDPTLFADLHRKYFSRNCFVLDSGLENVSSKFSRHEDRIKIRIGFEFETGNIASSFRALSKLDSLYKQEAIDVGVFVTSIDKGTTATRIWPVSNRNGSFQELKNRDYKRNVEIPLIEYGFRPDRIDSAATYLAADGTTYAPDCTGRIEEISGQQFRVYKTPEGREVLLP